MRCKWRADQGPHAITSPRAGEWPLSRFPGFAATAMQQCRQAAFRTLRCREWEPCRFSVDGL